MLHMHHLFMQTISQSKLKSFSIGMMNAGLKKPSKSKHESDEKKKVVKPLYAVNTINPETKEETASAQARALYKPMATLSATIMEQKIKTELVQPKLELKKKVKDKEKKKSNLELFKEELKRQQKEREIRHKIKSGDLADIPKDVLENMAPSLLNPSK
ncbi:hypothetical protein OS493_039851, partial [Desmophyllum pertusum]